jgi:hypothetical protein
VHIPTLARRIWPCGVLGSLCVLALDGCGGGGGGGDGGNANIAPTANAGADQFVIPSSSVTLAGSGTDADGTVTSYRWTQTAGTSVTLNSATSATAAFTAPATTGSLSFSLTVTDDRGAVSAADTVVVDVETAVAVTGNVSFDFVPFRTLGTGIGLDYGNISAHPARGIVVEAIDAANATTIVASTITDGSGNYSLDLAPSRQVFIRAKAEMRKLPSAGSSSSWDVQIRDNTNANALYAIDGSAFNTSTAGGHDLRAPVAFGGLVYTDRRAAPFAILDAVYDPIHVVLSADPTLVFPPLNIYWSTRNQGSANLNLATGLIGSTHFQTADPAGIYVQGLENDDTDEYDSHVIVHELGHYLLSSFSRDDSIGGPHSGENLDARVAFSEGWADAWSGIGLADPLYRDSLGPGQQSEFGFDIEQDAGGPSGWYSETAVQSLIYDLTDSIDDGPDTIGLGFAPIYEVMINEVRTTDAFSTIYPFVRGLRARQPALLPAIDTLVQTRGIIPNQTNPLISPDFGPDEIFDGGDPRNLPIYVPLDSGGSATVTSRAVASTDGSTRFNKLGNRRFLLFTLTAPRSVTISVSAAGCGGPPPAPDPDVILFHAGTEVTRAETVGCDTLTSGSLPAGVYVIETYEFSNIRLADGMPAGDTDITVTLN